jgi:hypothetical protein
MLVRKRTNQRKHLFLNVNIEQGCVRVERIDERSLVEERDGCRWLYLAKPKTFPFLFFLFVKEEREKEREKKSQEKVDNC